METKGKFELGRIVITARANTRLMPVDVMAAIRRHHSGDWGDVCDHDRRENERALIAGRRLFSVYRSSTGIKFYIITEHNRSATTVLLPEDY